MEMVFDSSTLILLSKTKILGIVSENIQIIIPKMVKVECTCKDTFDEYDKSKITRNSYDPAVK